MLGRPFLPSRVLGFSGSGKTKRRTWKDRVPRERAELGGWEAEGPFGDPQEQHPEKSSLWPALFWI